MSEHEAGDAPRPRIPECDWNGCETIYMPRGEWGAGLRQAMVQCLPPGTTMGFNTKDDLAWVTVSKPGNTWAVLTAARKRIGRA
jgi:hypothetical protein